MKLIEGHSHLFDKDDIAHGALGSKCLYYFVNKHTIEDYIIAGQIPDIYPIIRSPANISPLQYRYCRGNDRSR